MSRDITLDFMDMTAGRRLWARRSDVRDGVTLGVGDHVVVGDENADDRAARVTALDENGNVELEVLDGPWRTIAIYCRRARPSS